MSTDDQISIYIHSREWEQAMDEAFFAPLPPVQHTYVHATALNPKPNRSRKPASLEAMAIQTLAIAWTITLALGGLAWLIWHMVCK